MAKVRFSLNGKSVEAESGNTILEAAEQNGVEIPTLCHDPRLKPTAACRLCLVEVEGARGHLPACATPLTEGMVVRTQTDDLVNTRRMALELLLSDHYGDCVAPCKLACPAGIDIQGYIGLIAVGQYEEALKLIKESNPLPLACGRVCPRFCEAKCRRNLVDEPVAINALKRFVADYGMSRGEPHIPKVKPATGHRVAIVGGGPSGLSTAYYLALEGHEVTIFESSPQLGGMLRYGIPEYRLPKAILDKEIGAITSICHQVNLNVSLGRDFTVESLKDDGYEAIFIALGAQASQTMRIEGEDLPGTLSGIGFLRDVILGKEVSLGQKVAVIGGGNTAIDAARTALRSGVGKVTIIYRRSREEMPANDEEVAQAEEEGVQFHFLAAPVKMIAKNGRVDSIECTKMALGKPDDSGRRRPEPVAGSEFTMGVDTVIAAIGQTIDASGLAQDGHIEFNKRNYIAVNEQTMETSLEGVFAGGDCVSGPATVVEAVAAGRRAATSINQYLSGQPVEPLKKQYNCTKGELNEVDVSDYDDVARLPRTKMPALALERRENNFSEIELGFTEEMAKAETERCLACGCQDAFECKLRQLATEYTVNGNHYAGRKHRSPIKENEHSYILRDQNKCILCGRCVRICNEVQGIGALGFVSRGFDTVVEPTIGMPLAETLCESCGQCISTCPTGAITAKSHLPKQGPWELESVSTICPFCGIGCNLELNIIGDKIVNVTSPIGSPVNNGNLCKKGSFGYQCIQEMERLSTPLIKQGNQLVEANWDEAIAFAGKGLRLIKERSGGDRLAVLSSAQLTNEENYLAQKFARIALGTNNIGCLATPLVNGSLTQSFGRNASTCAYSDILASDLILVLGCDVTQDYPVIGLKIREAVEKGSKLVTINPSATKLDSLSKVVLKANPRISLALLRTILNYIVTHDLIDHSFIQSRTTGFEDFAREARRYSLDEIADMLWVKPSRIIKAIHLYIQAKRPVIVVNADTIKPAELTLISDMALITGNVGRDGAGIIALRTSGNAQGAIDMGVDPDYLPGQLPITNAAVRKKFEAAWHKSLPLGLGKNAIGIIEGVEKGDIQGILVLGGDAAGEMGNAIFEVPIFSVLVDTKHPETPPYPDVVLPGATFAESEGTFTNCERRIQQLHRAFSPVGGRENWELLSLLSGAMGYPMDYDSAPSVSAEIASLVPIFKAGINDGLWPFLEKSRFNLSEGLAQIRLAEPLEYPKAVEALSTFL